MIWLVLVALLPSFLILGAVILLATTKPGDPWLVSDEELARLQAQRRRHSASGIWRA